ncbi:porin [Rheinheimera muenzenbergensis]|uniref:Porin n=1 Tax=Rheinheimera muenzenbergensis TaxID=1193628 RepID=A0ABU8C293_9GAMM
MNYSNSALLMAGFTLLSVSSALAQAAETQLKMSGFASVGVNHVSNDSGYFLATDSGLHYKSDSLFGFKFDFDVNDKVDASVQLLSRGDNNWSNDVEWAYLSYAITPATKIRGGKLRLPLFIYSDFLDARFSLPWVRPPQEVYSVIPTSGYSGVELNYEQAVGDFNFTAQVYLGEAEPEELVSGATSKLTQLRGTTLSLAGENLMLRVSYATADIDLTLGTGSAIPAGLYQGDASFIGLGALYDDGSWLAVAEIVRAEIDTQDMSEISSVYLTLGRRFNDWMPYLTYARARNASDFPDVLAQQFLEAKRQTLSVGLRWDLARGMSLKSELSRLFSFEGSRGLLRNNSIPLYSNGQLSGFSIPHDSVFVSSVSLDVIF